MPEGTVILAAMAERKLLDQVSDLARLKHLSLKTEEAYRNWIKRFIFFHGKRHPRELDAAAVRAFLTYLAVDEHVSASTQNQAFSALLFLYKEVLQIEALDITGGRSGPGGPGSGLLFAILESLSFRTMQYLQNRK
jgi:hypothetical protein